MENICLDMSVWAKLIIINVSITCSFYICFGLPVRIKKHEIQTHVKVKFLQKCNLTWRLSYLQPLHLLFHGNAVKGFIFLRKNVEILPRATQPIREGPESILRLCDALRFLLELSEGLLNDKRENPKGSLSRTLIFPYSSM